MGNGKIISNFKPIGPPIEEGAPITESFTPTGPPIEEGRPGLFQDPLGWAGYPFTEPGRKEMLSSLEKRNQAIASGDPQVALDTVLSFAPLGMAVKGAQGAKGPLSRLFGKKTITPEIQKRIDISKELDVPLTAAQITQRKPVGLLQTALEKNIASSGIAQRYADAQTAALNAAKGKVQQFFGGTMDNLSAGQIAQEAGKSKYRQFMRKAGDLYSKVPVQPDILIETNILRDVATGHLDELGTMSNPAMKRVLKLAQESMESNPYFKLENITGSAGQPFVGGRMPTYTWQQLLSDQSAIRKMSNQTSDFAKKRVYNNIVNAINDDIAVFAKNVADPKVKESLDLATAFYKEGDKVLPGVNTFRDRKMWNALHSGSPEKITEQFMKPNNVSDIYRLRQVVGDDGMQPIKQAWLERLFTKGEEQSFSPQKFVSAFDKYDLSTLRSFLTTEEYEGLKKLADVIRPIEMLKRTAGNPSGTAQVGGTMVTIWNAFRHPIWTAGEMVGAKKFANMYFNSPNYRNYLIHGIQNPIAGRVDEMGSRLMLMGGNQMAGGNEDATNPWVQ